MIKLFASASDAGIQTNLPPTNRRDENLSRRPTTGAIFAARRTMTFRARRANFSIGQPLPSLSRPFRALPPCLRSLRGTCSTRLHAHIYAYNVPTPRGLSRKSCSTGAFFFFSLLSWVLLPSLFLSVHLSSARSPSSPRSSPRSGPRRLPPCSARVICRPDRPARVSRLTL